MISDETKKRRIRPASYLPIGIDIKDKKIVFIGGGKVALQKLKTVLLFGPRVTVVAPEILPEIGALGVRCVQTSYHPDLLKDVFLVYACTSNRRANRTIARDAAAQKILCNVADDTKACAFISPAVLTAGDLVVAVNSQGRAPKLAREARDFIGEHIDEFLHGRS